MTSYPILDRLLRTFTIAGIIGVAALLLGAVMIATAPMSSSAAAVGSFLMGAGVCLSYTWYRARRSYRREVARLDARKASTK